MLIVSDRELITWHVDNYLKALFVSLGIRFMLFTVHYTQAMHDVWYIQLNLS